MADIFSSFPGFPSASILPLSSESTNIKIKAQKWQSFGWFLLLGKKPVNRHGRSYMQQLQSITICLLIQSSIFRTWRYVNPWRVLRSVFVLHHLCFSRLKLADILERTAAFFWCVCVEKVIQTTVIVFFWTSELVVHSVSFQDSATCVISANKAVFPRMVVLIS